LLCPLYPSTFFPSSKIPQVSFPLLNLFLILLFLGGVRLLGKFLEKLGYYMFKKGDWRFGDLGGLI